MGKFNITVALVACALLTTAAGCGEKKTIENGGTVAVTPLAQPGATCSSGAAYGGVYPEAYTNIGFQPYGQQARYPRGVQYHSQSGFCGCPSGYQPTCDMQYGMTCVPVMGLQNYEVAYWQLQNGGFVFNGFSGYAGYGNVYANQYPGAYGYGDTRFPWQRGLYALSRYLGCPPVPAWFSPEDRGCAAEGKPGSGYSPPQRLASGRHAARPDVR